LNLIEKARLKLGMAIAGFQTKGVPKLGEEGWAPLNVGSYLPGDRPLTPRELAVALIGYSYDCINIIAEVIGMLDFHLEGTRGEEKITLSSPTEHPFLKATKSPTPPMSRSKLWYLITGHLELFGQAFLLKQRGPDGLVNAFQVLSPLNTRLERERPGSDNIVVRVYGKGIETYPLREVVYFFNPHLLGTSNSYSTVQAVYPHLNLQRDIILSEAEKLQKRDFPSLLFESDEDLDEDRLYDFQKYLEEKIVKIMRGKVAPVIPAGIKTRTIGFERDLTRPVLLKEVRDKILSAWRVPEALLSMRGGTGYISLYGEFLSFVHFTIKPKAIRIAQDLNSQCLATDYPGLALQGIQLSMVWDFPSSEDRAALVAEINATRDFRTVNEIRHLLGDKPLAPQDGDVILRSSGVTPVPVTIQQPGISIMPFLSLREELSESELTMLERKWLFETDHHEKKIKSAAQRFFEAQRQEVLHKWRSLSAPREIKLFNKREWNEKFFRYLHDPVRSAFVASYMNGLRKEKKAALFDESSDEVIKFYEGLAITHQGELVNENTMQKIAEAIRKGLENRESVSEIAERIERVFALASGWRAITIARTSAVGASNAGLIQAWSEFETPVRPVWFAMLDHRTRDPHRSAHRQVAKGVKGDWYFVVGGERLKYPGDPDGSPGNIINCRCTMIAKPRRLTEL